GYASHPDDVEIILSIGRAIWDERKGRVVSALEIGPPQQIRMELDMLQVDGRALETNDPQLHQEYTETFGKLRAMNEEDDRKCAALLQKLQEAKVAKLLAKPNLVTLSGKRASWISGGESAVPYVTGFGSVGFVQFPRGDTPNLPHPRVPFQTENPPRNRT